MKVELDIDVFERRLHVTRNDVFATLTLLRAKSIKGLGQAMPFPGIRRLENVDDVRRRLKVGGNVVRRNLTNGR